MNKKRNQFIYKFTGTILSRQLLKAPPNSKYANQEYYRINLKERHLKSLQVFPNKLTNPLIWTALKSAQWGELSKKRFVFHCQNVRGFFHLLDWKELPAQKGDPD